MTIIVPVAITPAGLPLPDPGDRATFSARKLEQLRWANNEYSTGSKALADASYANALDSQASATRAQIDATASAQNAALAATHAGATMWVPGTYALGVVVSSPSTGWLFRKKTASSATSVDPINDPANWAAVSSVAPKQLITNASTQAVAGGAYALTNSTAQGAATNLILSSQDMSNPVWTKNSMSAVANQWDAPDGSYTANLLTITSALDPFIEQTVSSPAILCHSAYVLRGGGNADSSVTLRIITVGSAGFDEILTFSFDTLEFSGNTGAFLNYGYEAQGANWYRIWATKTAIAGQNYAVLRIYPGSRTIGKTVLCWGINSVPGAGAYISSYIPTGATPVTRPAGVIAPQRIVLPVSPNSNDAISVIAANSSSENIIDPNGQQFYGPSGPLVGPLKLDSKNAAVDLQFINGYWRSI